MSPIRRLHTSLVALLLATLARAQPVAEPDYLIYTDSLVNGWQNWSFNATTTNSAAFIHSGSNAVAVTTTAGFGALSVHISGFDSNTYASVSFWINGGASGGQSLQVICRSKPASGGNETSSAAVTLSTPLANSWQQITIPLSSFGGTLNRASLTGFWIQSRSSSAQSTFYVDDMRLVSATAPSTVTITVSAATALRTADARIFGINTPMWDSNLNTGTTAALLAEMGLLTLRYPGGSNSDSYHWATNRSDGNTWTWATGFDSFAQLAAAAGVGNVIITTNYGSGTATEAADWVTYANTTKRYNYRYWEVGNEIYGSWENDTNALPHDPTTYANRFKDYYTQMKARDPSIKIGAVVVTGEDAYTTSYATSTVTNPRTGATHHGWTPVMLATLRSLGITPDFAIHHKYPPFLGDAGLLQYATTWAADAADLRQQLNDYLGTATASGVELVCTETNGPITNNNGIQSTSLITGLYYADSLGQILQTEFNGCTWWNLRNGRTTMPLDPSLYAWRTYRDGGMMSGTPAATDRYPASYVAKVTNRFAAGGDTVVSSGSNYQRLASYAARRTDGSLSVLVINKHATATLSGLITVTGLTPASRAVAYAYGIAQDEAARTGVGSPDITQTTISGVGASFTRSFPPYSVTVLSLKPALAVTTSTLGGATVGAAYAQALAAAGGAAGNLTWTVASGTLPPGLTLAGASLAGTSTSAGTYGFTLQAADAIGNVATQSLTISVANVPFPIWVAQHFSPGQQADPAVSDPTADPDHDGLSNLMEFALNRSPFAPDTPLVSTIEIDPNDQQPYFTFTYTRRKVSRDITYHLEVSSDLATWIEDSAQVQEISATDDGNGLTETVKVRLASPVPATGPQGQFLRLRVTQP